MNSRSIRTTRRLFSKAGWWSQLLVIASFCFYLNYVPIHLATTAHMDEEVASSDEMAFHHDGHDDHDHGDHDTDHHVPHPASDHHLNLTAQTHAPAVALAVFFLLADTSVLVGEPKTQAVLPLIEHLKPPGESPPDPLQPRAPPFA